jgi:hypothetical protein
MKKQFKYLGFNNMGKTTQTSKSNGLYTLLTTGQLVGLDKDLANSSEVTVVRQTPKRLYTTVTGDGKNEWDVMTCRLTVL